MQQDAHPARLGGCCPVPLTLLAPPTASTVSNPGGVEYPQRAIGFSALFGRMQRVASEATEGPVRLENKVLPTEAIAFQSKAAVGGP